ncbi:LysE family translocator [Rhodoligotrophos defluvii]|uniref:LysE family translocator n=1 Tax=Rhodoligotrophos defluvii TaxID=2561934 RepID=UPI0010C9C0E4|nr:LysE family transporter [Rhodoligotrophos defluvii]
MDWALILSGIGIGIAVAAPIGPINVMVINAALRRGFRSGVSTGSGAVLGDGCFALIAAFGLTAVSDFIEHYDRAIAAFGGVVLLVLGVRTMVAPAQLSVDNLDAAMPARPDLGNHVATLGTTLLLTITNPATLMGFIFIFSSASGLVSEDESYAHATALVLAVMGGSLLWWIVLSAIVSHFRDRLSSRALRIVNAVSGGLIAGFGGFVLARSLWQISF